MIELDELRGAWQALDAKLDRQYALDLARLRETRARRARGVLWPLKAGQLVQLLAAAVVVALSATFWSRHFDSPQALVYGLSLHLYGVMLGAFAVRDLIHIGRIDFAAPVLDIQRRLAELAAWRLRCGVWFAATGCFVWVPLMLAIFYSLGADVWAHKPQVVGWFLVSSGVALAAVAVFVRWARRPGNERLAHALDESTVGRSVLRARAALDELQRFERD